MDTLKCIKTRRSERDFLRKKIPIGILNEILDAARWAPTAGNIPHVRLVVVDDEKLRKKILDACVDAEWAYYVPCLVVVCSIMEEIKRSYGSRGVNLYAIQDSAVAVQNILLAAKNFGVGGCWIGAFSESAVKRLIKLKDSDVEIHAIVALGYPRVPAKPPIKLDPGGLIYFNEWGNKERNPPKPLLEKKSVKKLKNALKRVSKKL